MSAAQILDLLPKLSDEELRQDSHVLAAVFRERHQIVLDDEYGTMAEANLTALAGKAWPVIDGANKVRGTRAALIHDHMNILCMAAVLSGRKWLWIWSALISRRPIALSPGICAAGEGGRD